MTSESARDTGLAGQDTAATAGQARSTGPPSRHVVRRTRIGGIWVAFALFALVLLLLLIFIAENNRTVDVAYFGAHGHVPLGVALLLAAVLGVLLVAVPGTARIIQLRITARRRRRLDAATPASSAARRPVMQRSPVNLTEPRKPGGSWPDVVMAGSGRAFGPC